MNKALLSINKIIKFVLHALSMKLKPVRPVRFFFINFFLLILIVIIIPCTILFFHKKNLDLGIGITKLNLETFIHYYYLFLFSILIHTVIYVFLKKYSIKYFNLFKKHNYLSSFLIFIIFTLLLEAIKILPHIYKGLHRLNTLRDSLPYGIKDLQNVIDNIDTGRTEIFGWVFDLIEKYQKFLTSLTLDQLVALFNIFGDIMILTTLTSIVIVLIGDYLINKLNLEVRYPKLAKYIRLKEKLNKHYLIIYIVIFYIIVFLSIIGNIYMLFLKYFI